MKTNKWSATKILDTKGCIRRFQKKWIENAPIEVNIPEYEEGKKRHDAIQLYLTTGNLEYLKELNNNALIRDLDILRQYGKIETEMWLEDEKLEGAADIVIDRDDSWIVIDIKSRFDNEIDTDVKVQLYIYLYLLQKIKEKSDATIGIIAVHNQYQPLLLQKAEIVDVEGLSKFVEHQIKLAERRLEHGQINTSYCRYCSYIMSCDVAQKEATQDINDIAQKYVALKSLLSRYEDILRMHVEQTGENIGIDDLEIGYHIKNVTEVDEVALLDIAKKARIEHLVYKPNVTAIKKLAKKIPDLANVVSIRQDYYFGVKKQKEDKENEK